MNSVVIDTHVALWWSLGLEGLSHRATQAIGAAETIGIPAICFWEVAVLIQKKKVALDVSVQEWATLVLRIPRVVQLPLTASLAARADDLPMHPDPADRFIVATAIGQDSPLLSKDQTIRKLKFVKTIW